MEVYDNAAESERLCREIANQSSNNLATEAKLTREAIRQHAAEVALQNVGDARTSKHKPTKSVANSNASTTEGLMKWTCAECGRCNAAIFMKCRGCPAHKASDAEDDLHIDPVNECEIIHPYK